MNKMTKLFAIALLLVASTSFVKAMDALEGLTATTPLQKAAAAAAVAKAASKNASEKAAKLETDAAAAASAADGETEGAAIRRARLMEIAQKARKEAGVAASKAAGAAKAEAKAAEPKVGCVHCACTGIRNVVTWDKPFQKAVGSDCFKGRTECVRNNDRSVTKWISLPIMYVAYTAGIVTIYVVAKKIAKKLKNKKAKAVALDVEKVA